MSILAALAPQLISWGQSFLEGRREVTQVNAQVKAEQRAKGINSWPGRFLAVFWFYPVVAGYVPWLQDSAAKGFEALESMPEWYVGVLLTITAAVFAVDKWQRWKR